MDHPNVQRYPTPVLAEFVSPHVGYKGVNLFINEADGNKLYAIFGDDNIPRIATVVANQITFPPAP